MEEEPTATSSHAPAKPVVFDPMSVSVDTPQLIKGRDVWLATCAQCHIPGLGGAPKIGDTDDWGPRLAKGKDVLYDHAINGFLGPQLNEMPPKGGFTHLSDEEVKLAVDFIVLAHE
ncbi:MAG: c-type cytochrome [Verrucomicrobiota bacterium]